MPRQTTSGSSPGGGSRKWRSTEIVRAEILDAAREVFALRGFAAAGVNEVVERSGASVGSIYHHFGSKTDIFMALWERHNAEQVAIARQGVLDAQAAGVTDPFDLLAAGARAYLEATWSRRDLVRVFQDGDTPPGFTEEQRRSGRSWLNRNFRLLGATDEPVNRVLVWLVTSYIGEARREISRQRTPRAAREQVEAMLEVLERMRPLLADADGIRLVVRDDEPH
ncbi:TetR/AcrR family transcriptional regulator [Actinomadura sp. WMMB 499]|uniref:TetR/AcrR family transcriptional regulator n=1 Tax=Actinomadura sp. WMMB 499 TaxID=1219491 RepID=UPI0012455F53|nr:TetR/AcrR family transcriptional regulator [Actinomadura sp. WMMB 499]QFG21637.1 TetR/AcrR family transcriptional regulator [Actinomadura sp. WMMB 499]